MKWKEEEISSSTLGISKKYIAPLKHGEIVILNTKRFSTLTYIIKEKMIT